MLVRKCAADDIIALDDKHKRKLLAIVALDELENEENIKKALEYIQELKSKE